MKRLKKMKGPKKGGVFSYDGLFSVLPMVLLITLSYSLIIEKINSAEEQHQQRILEKRLLTYSDVFLAKCSKKYRFGEIKDICLKKEIPTESGKKEIEIGMDKKPTGKTCIYRVVVYNGEIKKLYFCSGG